MAKIRSKYAFKKHAGKCAFCDEKDYSCLDAHRIYEGYKGGEYDSINVVVCCANCHRKIHSGNIKLIKKHISYGESLYVLEYIENNETKFLSLKY
jgi:hypothetical protein